jgi:diguanylate cyclase (GGDEF)-like protein
MALVALDDTGRLSCLDQVHASLRRSALVGIPASALLAVTLHSAVPAGRLVAFVCLVSAADVAMFVVSGSYLARRQGGQSPRGSLTLVASVGIGAAWGALAVIALPDVHHVEFRTVYLLFACGVSATMVVGAAASRPHYFAGQLPMLVLIFVSFSFSGDGTTRMLGFAVPIYFSVMTALHYEVHRLVISEVSLRARNDDANAKLLERAFHDDLTGLRNRAAFIETLTNVANESTASGSLVGLLYLDVDRLKVVNDSLGHAAGDELLKAIGTRLRQVTRCDDVVARVGGDEFTLLLTDLRSHEDAMSRAEDVAAAFHEPFVIGVRPINVTASVGVTTNLNKNDDARALLAHADAALYRAKQAGRNRIEVFDTRLRESLERQLDDEQELREAISVGAIVPWFQPLIDLHTGDIVGAEALARWIHPTRGVIDAGNFMPLAEECGLVDQLDAAVVTSAFAARAQLQQLGVAHTFRIWCNVSATQFAKADPTARMVAALQRTGCDPTGVGIEITETAVLRDIHAAAREVRTARELGVEVALDDFGTGHSSLTLLRDLAIDKVKIDRSFVRDANKGRADTAIILSVVNLANQLGISVVAEGVETPEQAHLLRNLGCRYAQGHLWSRARPLDELVTQLAAADDSRRLVNPSQRLNLSDFARPTNRQPSRTCILTSRDRSERRQ